MNVSRALRVTVFALAALLSGSALAAGGPALVVERRIRPRAARGAGDRSLVSGLHHQADDRLCGARHGPLAARCGMDSSSPSPRRRRPAAVQDGVQARHPDPPRQRAQDHHGQVGERRRRHHRGESRRLDRGLRGPDERTGPRASACRTAASSIRTACPTSATRPRPATWRSWPGRSCTSFPDHQDLFRHRRDPVRPPDHAQHQRPHRPLSRAPTA